MSIAPMLLPISANRVLLALIVPILTDVLQVMSTALSRDTNIAPLDIPKRYPCVVSLPS